MILCRHGEVGGIRGDDGKEGSIVSAALEKREAKSQSDWKSRQEHKIQ